MQPRGEPRVIIGEECRSRPNTKSSDGTITDGASPILALR
jgi:hypothetical protein